jgi:hypothetical protein
VRNFSQPPELGTPAPEKTKLNFLTKPVNVSNKSSVSVSRLKKATRLCGEYSSPTAYGNLEGAIPVPFASVKKSPVGRQDAEEVLRE